MRLGRRDWLLIAIAVAVAAVCARLGVWQIDRLAQRRARNAAAATALAAPPLDAAAPGLHPDSVAGRRVRAAGVYDFTRERVRPGRVFDGVPGVAILTPLRLPDGRAVFVDRGWAASADARRVDLRGVREADTASVVGLGARLPRGPGDVDPARLADSLPYPVLAFGIQQLPSGTPTMLRRWPEPRLDSGPHLGYAVQWFSFGAIALIGTAVLLVKQHRRRTT